MMDGEAPTVSRRLVTGGTRREAVSRGLAAAQQRVSSKSAGGCTGPPRSVSLVGLQVQGACARVGAWRSGSPGAAVRGGRPAVHKDSGVTPDDGGRRRGQVPERGCLRSRCVWGRGLALSLAQRPDVPRGCPCEVTFKAAVAFPGCVTGP